MYLFHRFQKQLPISRQPNNSGQIKAASKFVSPVCCLRYILSIASSLKLISALSISLLSIVSIFIFKLQTIHHLEFISQSA